MVVKIGRYCEAVCFEIARRGVESNVFVVPTGAAADAIRQKHIEFQNKYAHKIHACFVDAVYRGVDGQSVVRKGRPSREMQLAQAVVAAV